MDGTLRIEALTGGTEPPMALLALADESRDHIEDCLRRGRCYIARVDGECVGTLVLLETRPLTVEITQVAVREDLQGQGIGRALILQAIRDAGDGPWRSIDICTGNAAIGQLALYQKCGFRIIGVDTDHFVREYDDPIEENGIACVDMIRLKRALR